MHDEKANTCIVLQLNGPMQSWGTVSQFNRRSTDLIPSRSAIMGILCAARGLPRGSKEEADWLEQCASLHMRAVLQPRKCRNRELLVRRLEDFHTVQGTLDAKGKIKGSADNPEAQLTHRQYLLDAFFYIFLSGKRELLTQIADNLQDPVWGLWLGRKCCIPSAPLFAGLFSTESDAMNKYLSYTLDELLWTEDATTFSQGVDSVPDMPRSFASHDRIFSLRRIVRNRGIHYAP